MCNLSRGVEKKGIAKGVTIGVTNGILRSIKAVMRSMNCAVDKAMVILEIPESEWPKYLELLNEQ